MNRRDFIKASSFVLPGVSLGFKKKYQEPHERKPLIIDGMGEIRLEYS